MQWHRIVPSAALSVALVGVAGAPALAATSIAVTTPTTSIQPNSSVGVDNPVWSPTYPTPGLTMDVTGTVNYNISWYDWGDEVTLTYGLAASYSSFSGNMDAVSLSGPMNLTQTTWLTPGGWTGWALQGETSLIALGSYTEQATGKVGVKTRPATPGVVGVGTYAGQEYSGWHEADVYFQ